MSTYAGWSEVKKKAQAVDPRGPSERVADKATAQTRHDAYLRGYQLAEMRRAAGVTQAELAETLGVSQARISKIEHGETSGIDVVRDYVIGLGGTVDFVATVGDRAWKVA